jgi:hypothetical protein
MLLSRTRANCEAFDITRLENGDIQYTIAWANARAGTQNDARQWAEEIFGYRTKEEKDRYIKIEILLIFKTLGWGTSTIGISTAGRKRFVSPAPEAEAKESWLVRTKACFNHRGHRPTVTPAPLFVKGAINRHLYHCFVACGSSNVPGSTLTTTRRYLKSMCNIDQICRLRGGYDSCFLKLSSEVGVSHAY